jgi:hypothetical protein
MQSLIAWFSWTDRRTRWWTGSTRVAQTQQSFGSNAMAAVSRSIARCCRRRPASCRAPSQRCDRSMIWRPDGGRGQHRRRWPRRPVGPVPRRTSPGRRGVCWRRFRLMSRGSTRRCTRSRRRRSTATGGPAVTQAASPVLDVALVTAAARVPTVRLDPAHRRRREVAGLPHCGGRPGPRRTMGGHKKQRCLLGESGWTLFRRTDEHGPRWLAVEFP